MEPIPLVFDYYGFGEPEQDATIDTNTVTVPSNGVIKFNIDVPAEVTKIDIEVRT